MSGYKILNEHNVIPGGWNYRVPETGIEIPAGSLPQLREFVRNHYAANAVKVPDNLDTLITEYQCRNGADCSYDEVEIPRPKGLKSLQIGDVIRFSMSLIHGLTVGGGKVDQAEAINQVPYQWINIDEDASMRETCNKMAELKDRFKNITLDDRSNTYNTELTSALNWKTCWRSPRRLLIALSIEKSLVGLISGRIIQSVMMRSFWRTR